MTYADWNCQLLPQIRAGVSTPQETLEALSVLQRYGIDHFCFMPEFSHVLEPVSRFLLRRDRAAEHLRSLLPPRVKVRVAASVRMETGLHLTEGLDRLCFTKQGHLALKMPIADYADWIDFEINRLLYRVHFTRLLFTSFDRCMVMYPTDILDKLMRIPHAVFQFHYHALADADARSLMVKLLRQNQTVLLGSEVNTLGKTYFFDFPYYLESAKKYMSVADFQTILRQNQNFWRK